MTLFPDEGQTPDECHISLESQTLLLEIGSLFRSQYRILEYIASGANGQVYKTKELNRGIFVALKVIPLSGDEKQILRFQQEARMASKLNHVNIATIFDFGVVDKLAYLALEYIDGQPLDELFKESSEFDLNLFIEVFVQISKAISHAHKRGVIHRDLKPGNILINENSDGLITAKILDFGLAKRVSVDEANEMKLTNTGLIVGTPLYMSPEQARSLPITPKSDIYSIGALMYTCLTGNAPLKAETAIETILLISNEQPRSLENAFDGRELPPEITELVHSMLSKDPGTRPKLDDEVIPALSDLQNKDSSDDPTKEITHIPPATNRDTVKKSLLVLLAIFSMGMVVACLVPNLMTPTKLDTVAETKTTHSPEPEPDQDIYQKKDETKICGKEELTDQSIQNFPKPTKVRDIDAEGSHVKTLEYFPRLTNLKILNLGSTAIDDAALKNLTTLKKLTNLNVNHTSIGNAGISELRKINTITHLHLSDIRATPEGLSELKGLFRLTFLDLSKNDFREADFAEIAQFVAPNCTLQVRTTDNDHRRDHLTADAVDRLQIRFPDIQFLEKDKTEFLNRLINAEAKLSGKIKSKKDWHDLKKEFEYLLVRATKLYGEDSPKLRLYHCHLGNVEQELSLIESPIRHYLAALKSAIDLGDKENKNILMRSILSLSMKLPENKAKEIDRQTWKSLEKIGVSKKEIVELYEQLAQDPNQRNDSAGVIARYKKAIAVEQSIDPRSPLIAQFYCYIGDVYSDMDDKKTALSYYLQSVNGFDQSPPHEKTEKHAYVMALDHASRIFAETKRYDSALNYSNRCFQLSKTFEIPPDTRLLVLADRKLLLQDLGRPDTEIEEVNEALKKTELKRRAVSNVSDGALNKVNLTAYGSDDQASYLIKNPERVRELIAKHTTVKTLEGFSRFRNLTALDLNNTAINDDSIRSLESLPLERLFVADNNISNKGLFLISKMQKLTLLNLERTKVTPEGLKQLRSLRKLQYLFLERNGFTEQDIDVFAFALPVNCYVRMDFSDSNDRKIFERLEARYPDLLFSKHVPLFLQRLRAANANLIKPNNTYKDCIKLKAEYEDLLRLAQKAYGKNADRLYELQAHIGDLDGNLQTPIPGRLEHYKLALVGARKFGDTDTAIVLVNRIISESRKLADQRSAKTFIDYAELVGKQLELERTQASR